MRIEIGNSARRHGISDERIRYVVEHCREPLYPPSDDAQTADFVLFLGPDGQANLLEVMGAQLADGGVRVFHAMKLRRRHLGIYERANEWHRK